MTAPGASLQPRSTTEQEYPTAHPHANSNSEQYGMTFSDDTNNVLDYLEGSSTEGLRKRNDVGFMLEMAIEREAHGVVNDLAFHGAHFYSLYTMLRRNASSADGYAVLEREFHAGAEKLRELIAGLLVGAEEEQVERFNSTYYQLTQGSLRNLVDLSHDLMVLKGVQNDMKHKSGGPGL